ncbi:aminoglycoside phosphotransferase family protein [Chitinophaga flava]|uniref:3'-kinase n=1 Tax=Chitinophaga flava TaxID=2259036 RepID=A0A365Y1K0_9BACT|nr:aminoglycoside phosphotransferase family protein [Chitinophaga flava]RBL91794.1 hypothetical protein DF182_04095 [Chitinophaga flava]
MPNTNDVTSVQEWRNEAAFQAGDKERKHYLKKWELQPDGPAFRTYACWLQPVVYQQQPAMLKIALEAEEQLGGILMSYWDGEGAARVLQMDGSALLLERISSKNSLLEMALNGQDTAASRIICQVADKLHAPRTTPAPAQLLPLATWFEELEPAAGKYGGILEESHLIAKQLLRYPQEICVLHGDLHHTNVLDAGARGWVAIDPRRLIGDRGFDYAHIFCNPDLETALAPGRLAAQVAVVASAANMEPQRLLKWIVAYSGLSAAWSLSAAEDASIALGAAEIAFALLSS